MIRTAPLVVLRQLLMIPVVESGIDAYAAPPAVIAAIVASATADLRPFTSRSNISSLLVSRRRPCVRPAGMVAAPGGPSRRGGHPVSNVPCMLLERDHDLAAL